MAKKSVVKIAELFDYRLGRYRSNNHVTLEIRGHNTKKTEVVVTAELPVWWFDDIARSMWQVINDQQKSIDQLKAAMQKQNQ